MNLNNVMGFTLLEILVSITIFAVLISTLFGSYNMVFGNAQSMEESAKIYQMVGKCLNQTLFDLQAVRVTPAHLFEGKNSNDYSDPLRFVGEIDIAGLPKLRFASENHLPLYGSQAKGIAEIVYYVQETPHMGRILRRSDKLIYHDNDVTPEWDPILCAHIKSVQFIYFDSDGSSFENWDSNSEKFLFASPAGVTVRLELETGSTTHQFETQVVIPVIREPMK